MNHFYKTFALISCAAAAAFCCSDDGFWESPRLLTKAILSDQKWEPFLPETPRYSPYSENAAELPSLEKAIALEWEHYKPSVSATSWSQFFFSGGRTPSLTQEEKAYIDFMSTVNPLINNKWDWDYEGVSAPRADSMVVLAQQAAHLADQVVKNSFLRQHYLFQALRLYHYAGQYDAVIALCASSGWERGEKSLTYWRMLALEAGALRKLKQNGASMALFAEVAQNSPELLYVGYRNAMYIEDWDAGLAAAKDPSTRAMLLFTKLVYQDHVDPVTVAALGKIEPGSSRSEVAFLKQVAAYERTYWRPALHAGVALLWPDTTFAGEELWSKMESVNAAEMTTPSLWQRLWHWIVEVVQKLFGIKPEPAVSATQLSGQPAAVAILQCGTPKLSPSPDGGYTEKDTLQHGAALLDYAVAMGESDSVPNRALYYIGAAQLALMTDNFADAQKYANKATELAGDKPAIRSAAALFTALTLLNQEGVNSEPFAQAANQFLALQADTDLRDMFFEQTGKAFLQERQYGNAAAAYLNRADNNVGGKLLLDVLMTIPEQDALQAQRKNPGSPFLAKLYAALPDDNGLAELAGNKYLRIGKFKEAVERFEQCDSKYWSQKSYRPIYVNRTATPDQQGMAIDSMGRLEFARAARDLLAKPGYNSYILLGNLFYHDWGWHYSDRLWEGYGLLDAVRSFDGSSSDFYVSPELSQELFNRLQIYMANYSSQQMAARFYAQAQKLAQTDEEKGIALFAFTAAKSTNWTSADNAATAAFDKRSMFTLLRDQVGSSPLLAEIAGRCSELRDFLNEK
jgi:tetratricopeptide (TPR) repeat protein